MKLTLTADIPDKMVRAGTVADVLNVIARDYGESGENDGSIGSVQWALAFKYGKPESDNEDNRKPAIDKAIESLEEARDLPQFQRFTAYQHILNEYRSTPAE